MGLIINLDEKAEAEGELFWDDGESYEYESNIITKKKLIININKLNLKILHKALQRYLKALYKYSKVCFCNQCSLRRGFIKKIL